MVVISSAELRNIILGDEHKRLVTPTLDYNALCARQIQILFHIVAEFR